MTNLINFVHHLYSIVLGRAAESGSVCVSHAAIVVVHVVDGTPPLSIVFGLVADNRANFDIACVSASGGSLRVKRSFPSAGCRLAREIPRIGTTERDSTCGRNSMDPRSRQSSQWKAFLFFCVCVCELSQGVGRGMSRKEGLFFLLSSRGDIPDP